MTGVKRWNGEHGVVIKYESMVYIINTLAFLFSKELE